MAASTALAASFPVPSIEAKRIEAAFGPEAYLPTFIPRGYIYTSWSKRPGTFGYQLPVLTVHFGRHGRELIWTVGDTRDSASVFTCASTVSRSRWVRIGGRKVLYSPGVRGHTTTRCIHTEWGRIAMTIWDGYSVSRSTLLRIAASARRAR